MANTSGKLDSGFFVFSLDTELATGYFDEDNARSRLFSKDGRREREAVNRLLELFKIYEIKATWAVVGHLFYKACEQCVICPLQEWKGKYKSYEEVYDTQNPLWYGEDVIDAILNHPVEQEIGFHGYSHKPFNQISREDAKVEIEEWLRVAGRKGIHPHSIVFPRNKVNHLDIFRSYGFLCYRANEKMPLITRNRYFGKYLDMLNHVFSVTLPPLYDPNQIEVNEGLVNLPSSQHLFRFDRRLDVWLNEHGYGHMRIRRILRAIQKAAEEKKIFHLWAHEWEFRTQEDFDKIETILRSVKEQKERSSLETITMTELSQRVLSCRKEGL